MESFQSMGLHEALNLSLIALGFQKPTPIQAQTIPHAIQGKDILGSAQTGTGKTIAYGIPLITYLLNNEYGSTVVLVPTRELAMQVIQQLHKLLGKKSSIKSALLIGGDSIFKQLTQLKSKPRLIVGTPGRINDHLERGSLKLNKAEFLVFDETDRMLDMGFSVQIQRIVEQMPEKRQTLMFSATMSPSIIKTAQNYMIDAVRISIGSTTSPTEKINQEIINTTEEQKYNILLDKLNSLEGSFIVFMKTKHATEKLATKLRDNGYTAAAIHGDLRQRNREHVIKSFHAGKNRILVATDVAARGLDIPHIECVINYDLPMNPEDYIHRIGRTGRAGKSGTAISFITKQEGIRWKAIHKLINEGKHTTVEGYKGSRSSNESNNKKKKDSRNNSNNRFKGDRSNYKGRKEGFGDNRENNRANNPNDWAPRKNNRSNIKSNNTKLGSNNRDGGGNDRARGNKKSNPKAA